MPVFSDDLASRQDGSFIDPLDTDESGVADRTVNELDLSASLTADIHPCKKYVALVTQVGVGDPSDVVLENTLDTVPGWYRVAAGTYSITSTPGIFLEDKVVVNIGIDCKNGGIGNNEFISAVRVSDDGISINTYDSAKANVDDILTDTPIEILIYP